MRKSEKKSKRERDMRKKCVEKECENDGAMEKEKV